MLFYRRFELPMLFCLCLSQPSAQSHLAHAPFPATAVPRPRPGQELYRKICLQMHESRTAQRLPLPLREDRSENVHAFTPPPFTRLLFDHLWSGVSSLGDAAALDNCLKAFTCKCKKGHLVDRRVHIVDQHRSGACGVGLHQQHRKPTQTSLHNTI